MIPLNAKATEFIACLKPICEVFGYDPYIILTHAWHESGAFEHVIGEHNYWGIKKPNVWTGKTIDVVTHEFIKGVDTKLTDTFIDFATCEFALDWYDTLIRRLYPESHNNKQKYEPYFEGLQNFKYKYATDPNYVIQLKQLYVKLKNLNLLS